MIESQGETGGATLLLLAWSVASLFASQRMGFFEFTKPLRPVSFKLRYLLGAFAVYLGVLLLIYPLLSLLFPKTAESNGWLHLTVLVCVGGALLIYYLSLKREVRSLILGMLSWRELGYGVLTWLFCYPLVLLTSLLLQLLSKAIWGESGVKQVAVEELIGTMPYPLLFTSMIIVVVMVVPCIEELLFRGFLQTYLRKKWGSWVALLLSSLIFAFVHFAASQGRGNIELIPALFILSLFLGFLYEKRGSLLAPIGLHATFNAVNIVGLFFNAGS